MRRKERLTKQERQLLVYKKLLNYKEKGKGGEQIWNTIIKLDPVLGGGRLFKSTKTPTINHNNGWKTTSQIEQEPIPYEHPNKKRYEYLNDPLIEKNTYVCDNLIRTSRRKYEKKETVWRLKTDLESFRKICSLLIYKDKDINSFEETDYFQDNKNLWDKLCSGFTQMIIGRNAGLNDDLAPKIYVDPIKTLIPWSQAFQSFLEGPERFYGRVREIYGLFLVEDVPKQVDPAIFLTIFLLSQQYIDFHELEKTRKEAKDNIREVIRAM